MIRVLLLNLFGVGENIKFFYWQLLLVYILLLIMFGIISFFMRYAYRDLTGSARISYYLSFSIFFVWAISSFILVWNPFGWMSLVPVITFLGIMVLWFLFSLILSYTVLKKG